MAEFITESLTGDIFYVDPETGRCEIIDTTFGGHLKRKPIELKIVDIDDKEQKDGD